LAAHDDEARRKLEKVIRSGQVGRLRELVDLHPNPVACTMLREMLPETEGDRGGEG